MNKYRDTLQLLAFIEALKSRFRWEIPCISEPTEIFEIEKGVKDSWRFRVKDSNDWIDSSTLTILSTLDKNDVNLSFFKLQLRESILTNAAYCYNVVQEACSLLGEDEVYAKIEDDHHRLEEEISYLIEGDLEISPLSHVIKGIKKE